MAIQSRQDRDASPDDTEAFYADGRLGHPTGYGLGLVRRSTADLMLIATVTLWAFNFTVSKYILDEGFHPLAYSSIR